MKTMIYLFIFLLFVNTSNAQITREVYRESYLRDWVSFPINSAYSPIFRSYGLDSGHIILNDNFFDTSDLVNGTLIDPKTESEKETGEESHPSDQKLNYEQFDEKLDKMIYKVFKEEFYKIFEAKESSSE